MAFLGHKLRELRQAKGWSERKAERETGLRQSVISGLESGRTTAPRPATVAKLCAGFGVPPEYFYGEAGPPITVLPDLPPRILAFLLDRDSVGYLEAVVDAREKGLTANQVKQVVSLLGDVKTNR